MNAKRNDNGTNPSPVAATTESSQPTPPEKPLERRRSWFLPSRGNPRFALFSLTAVAFLILLTGSVRHRVQTRASDPAVRGYVAAPLATELGLREARRDGADKAHVAETKMSMQPFAAAAPESPAKVQRTEFSLSQPMIARSVSLSLVAKDFSRARSMMDEILLRHHGYAAELTVNAEQTGSPSLEASLRIPAEELPGALGELKSLGKIASESQKGEDVSPQHSDLVARLKNARETEQRLQGILLERTGKMSDVLEVEQEISRVRGEIEQMQAEQEGLEHRVAFASLDLRIDAEFRAQLATPSFLNRLRNAVVEGFQGAADSLIAILLFCLTYGPTTLLWLLIVLLPARFLWKRSRGFPFRQGG